ncbi:hypothetical protein DdX_16627 [Ditylenchus destructor]|uniref:Uncharacterized protein n=1 Tax=Ditylenchus destructor TaxID=166010 RepID=A0AAD4QZX2_9BILA|nr:hypothetical protein DdX_16627 [Ditylenchus destructor]
MSSFRKTSVIFLLFLTGFITARNLMFGEFETSHVRAAKDCSRCVDDCIRDNYDDIMEHCIYTPTNVTCICDADKKTIECLESCGNCAQKQITVQQIKKYDFGIHCPPSNHKLF